MNARRENIVKELRRALTARDEEYSLEQDINCELDHLRVETLRELRALLQKDKRKTKILV